MSPRRAKARQEPKALEWRSFADRLWPNQTDALERLEAYLRLRPRGGALVQMPTGSGKTVIIAVSARIQAQVSRKAVIVVSPAQALAAQLTDDISRLVWERLGLDAPWNAVAVTALLRSNAKGVRATLAASSRQPAVLVGTLQALNDIRLQDTALYYDLARATSLVIVDEGHRQPAPEWFRSVESLGTPVILFSATPYRNDYRAFNVDRNRIVYRSFDWAVDERLIRDVTFETLEGRQDAGGFAVAAAGRFSELLADQRILADSKAILRFADARSIQGAIAALERDPVARDLGFVGVHETFHGDDPLRLQALPDLRARPERLFLHQFKLSEGIDEPRCAVLFLHRDFSNERQLVQQIGRCVRRIQPRTGEEPNAIVIVAQNSGAKVSWDAYRAFDRSSTSMSGPPIFDEGSYGRRLRELGVPAEYAGRKFRLAPPAELSEDRVREGDDDRADLERQLAQDVLIPRRCYVYQADADGDFDEVISLIMADLVERGRHVLASVRPFPDEIPDLHVAVCHVMELSDLFERFAFMENAYTVTVLFRRSARLYLFDSSRLVLGSGLRVGPSEIGKLLPEDPSTRITMAATRNTDLSANVARARTVETASLRNTPPSLSDFLSVLSRASGRVESQGTNVGRYIGLFTGRVSDARSRHVDLHDFVEWCGSLERDLDATADPAHVFRRFAQPITPPEHPDPRNILLDVSNLGTAFRDPDTDEELNIEDYCVDVRANDTGEQPDYPWMFDVTLAPRELGEDGQQVASYLQYDAGRAIFHIHSDELTRYVSVGEEKPVSALAALDQAQSFRIILGQNAQAYAYNHFFDVAPSRSLMRSVVDDLLVTDTRLHPLTSEKGDSRTAGRMWDADSVFGFVDAHRGELPLRLHQGGWDALICDDQQTEIADFVAYRMNPPALAFIHAKRPVKRHLMSASALHDVLAQAVKNLDAIRLGGSGIPAGRAARWNAVWRLNARAIPRIRFGAARGSEHVQNIAELSRSASTQRLVGVVLAGAIEKQRLLDGLDQRHPDVEAIQAFIQLTAFYAETMAVGVIPTVICD